MRRISLVSMPSSRGVVFFGLKPVTPLGECLLKSEEAFAQQKSRPIAMSNSTRLPKPKRSRMEIYNDILKGIEQELRSSGEVKPTRVAQRCNLAYDKFSRYLGEMAAK